MKKRITTRINEAIKILEDEYDWFKELDQKEKFYYATRYLSTKKEDLQRARMWISLIHTIVPWAVALYALFSR